ncbi:MAG TPA: recombinase family protein [bacterium]|nr:recombinase family protein [bacterium]HPT29525.1 recombinase family protein [bacterium]
MQKGIIYYRVSTEDQAQTGVSLEQQKNACLDYAQKNDIEILKLFHDDGVSAKTTKRAGLQELLAYCKKNHKEIDCLIVYKIDRLSRNVKDYATLLMALGEFNIKFISTTETVNETSSGKLIGTIMASFAQFDNDVRSERVSVCMLEKAKQGIWCFKAPFGYLNSRDEQNRAIITIDKSRAEIIKMAFEKFATGLYKMEEIRIMMIKAGFKTWRDKEISIQSVFRILIDKFYIGVMTIKGQEYQGSHEVFINENTFYKCQKLIRTSKRGDNIAFKRTNEMFPLRNFILCPSCGRPFTACLSRNSRGNYYPYYRCYNKNCRGYKSISKDKLENKFSDYLKSIAPDPYFAKDLRLIVIEEWEKKIKNYKGSLVDAKNQLEVLELEKSKLIEMKKKDLLDDNDFKEEMSKVKIKIAEKQSTPAENIPNNFDIKKQSKKVFDIIPDLDKFYNSLGYYDKLKFQSLIFPEKVYFDFSESRTAKMSLILQNKRELATASSPKVPLREKISKRFNEIIGEIKRWARFLDECPF